MLKHLPSIDSRHGTFATNKDLAARLKALYQTNGCWTWYDGYEWPDDETFSVWHGSNQHGIGDGKVFPMNLVRIEWPPSDHSKETWRRQGGRLLRKLKRGLALHRSE